MTKEQAECQLMYICMKCNVPLCKGIYRDYRISTSFESFEFDIGGDGKIHQIYHYPKIHHRKAGNKTLFHKQLKGESPSMGIEDAVRYICRHSNRKFLGINQDYMIPSSI